MTLINEIYQNFIDYYGKERVDIINYYNGSQVNIDLDGGIGGYDPYKVILVHWPTVTITNEQDAHIDIWDLYAAIPLTREGKLAYSFFLNRATYDNAQWSSDYQHSHTNGINRNNLGRFRESCLGSGPIRNTRDRLRDETSRVYTDINIWMLFIWELDKYVHVESLIGYPYRHLQDVGNTHSNSGKRYSSFTLQPNNPYSGSALCKNIIEELVKAVIENKVLKFNYVAGKYSIAHTYIDTVVKISNLFIELYNTGTLGDARDLEYLFDCGFISTMVIDSGYIYPKASNEILLRTVIGASLGFKFKGEEVFLKAKDVDTSAYANNELTLLNIAVVNYIVCLLLKYINFGYGKETGSIDKKSRIV